MTGRDLPVSDSQIPRTAVEPELVKQVNHLEEASTASGMQISAEKTQLMTNNTNGVDNTEFN